MSRFDDTNPFHLIKELPNLVAYYPLYSDINDYSGNGYNLTLRAGSYSHGDSIQPRWNTGSIGDDNWALSADLGSSYSGDFTLGFIHVDVGQDSASGSTLRPLIGFNNDNFTSNDASVSFLFGGIFSPFNKILGTNGDVTNVSSTKYVNSSAASFVYNEPEINTPEFMVIKYRSSDRYWETFRNGVSFATFNSTASELYRYIYLGGMFFDSNSGSRYFKGSVSDVFLCHTLLNTNQIEALTEAAGL